MLAEKITDLVSLGFKVSFRREPLSQLAITVEREGVEKESWLPLRDHCEEGNIKDALTFMQTEIDNKLNS